MHSPQTECTDFEIDVFWSFRSPYCYFALDRLIDLERRFEMRINVRPVYPMAVRNPNFFQDVNKKYRQYHLMDCERVAAHLNVPYRRPIPDPIVQNMDTNEIAVDQPYIRQLTLLGTAAQLQGKGLAFLDKIARLLWDGKTDGWNEGNHLLDATNAAGLDGQALFNEIAENPDKFETVVAENQKAHDASAHWGVPLMTFRGETFYGQDRVDLLLWRMRNEGLTERNAVDG